MTSGRMRAAARDLQRVAADHPLARAPHEGAGAEQRHFAKIDRELTWGLTLNK